MFSLARAVVGLGIMGSACGKSAPPPPLAPHPTDVKLPPSADLPDDVTRPPAQRHPNLTLSCHPISDASCENPSYTLTALGDRVESCTVQRTGAATSIRLQLRSSNDVSLIIVAFDGYHGTGEYALGTPGSRYVSVDDTIDVADCNGVIQHDQPRRVSAADPNCGSPACVVKVTDSASADVPFPEAGRPVTFDVTCPSLCQNGGNTTCPGPIHFVTRATCTP